MPRCSPRCVSECSDSDNLHTRIIAQLLEDAGAIFPGQSKSLHVSQTETRYRITYGVVIRLFKIGFHHGDVRPRYQLIKGNFVMQISRQLTSHSFARELHCLILLNLLVTFVYWVFFVDFNQLTLSLVNLLPESYRIFVDLFHVARFPAAT